jgi:hypothetical protein
MKGIREGRVKADVSDQELWDKAKTGRRADMLTQLGFSEKDLATNEGRRAAMHLANLLMPKTEINRLTGEGALNEAMRKADIDRQKLAIEREKVGVDRARVGAATRPTVVQQAKEWADAVRATGDKRSEAELMKEYLTKGKSGGGLDVSMERAILEQSSGDPLAADAWRKYYTGELSPQQLQIQLDAIKQARAN